MQTVPIGKARVSRLCIGGNPFSGFSHQNPARSKDMTAYYTPEKIVDALRLAEEAGLNTCFMRTDDHIFGIVRKYREAGVTLQWFAQVSQEKNDPDSWRKWLNGAIALGATGTYIHGGIVDFWYANGQFDNFREALDTMREGGVVAGFAGHKPQAHEWIRDNLQVDFQMCSYYNPTDRSKHAAHIETGEKWEDEDRQRMIATIQTIKTPVVHYKVLAAGNKPIEPSFEVLGKAMRPGDVTNIGMFLGDDPDMITKNIALFEKYVG
ncbi:MAG: hypothetical protein JXR37_00970 [Kiritimatiellae bacterium]|nr:hypothetical protein [Kiritimatiellia bacterium]